MALRQVIFAIAIALGPLGLAAHASPRSDPTTGRAVFTGATMPSPTSIMLDPAAIGIGPVDEIYFAGTAVLDQISIARNSLALDGSLTSGGNVSATPMAPGGQIAALWHFGRVTLGASFGSPPSAPYIKNADALRYQVLGGSLRDYTGAIAASFKVTDDFYFGVSAALDDIRFHLHYLRDTALEKGHGPHGVDSDCNGAPCGVENAAAAERYDIHASSLTPFSDYIVNLGVAIQPFQNVWVAAAYHTAPGLAIQSELHGTDSEVTLSPRDGGKTLYAESTVYMSLPASVDAELRARVAQGLDLHVGFRWEDLSRFQSYSVRTYGDSTFGTDVAEWNERARGMHDAFALWAGVEQVDTGAPIVLFGSELPLRFGARIGFESSAVENDRISALTIAPASATLDGGVQYRHSNIVLQLSYGLQYFFPVDVSTSAFDPRDRINCINSGFDYSTAACASVRTGYAIPSAAGHYDRIEHSLRVGLVYEFP